MKTMRRLVLLTPLALAAGLFAQTVNFLTVTKRQDFIQNDNSTTVAAGSPWVFVASVEGTTLSGITTPVLTIPSGTGSTTMTYNSGDNAWQVTASFGTQGALDAAYGSGNYSLTALGQTVTPISLTGDTYPAVPLATNLSGGTIVGGVLTWDVSQALTITITGTADHMGINVSGNSYNGGTESFGTGIRSHTFIVPASSLVAGNSYTVQMGFDDIVGGTNVFSFSGTGGMSAATYAGLYSTQTTFTIQAVPEPATYAVILGVAALLALMASRRRAAQA